MRAFDITITGGEPALWPGLVPALERSRQLEFASLQLITNGLSTNPRMLGAIEASKLSRICVSLDGVSDVHDTNRGEGNYARTMRGLRQLVGVHGNVTVISVVDATNHQRWRELTEELVEIGVTQHHLAPVCFAGHAMSDYRGLSAEQFAEVAADVEHVAGSLPTGFLLRFNDTLLRAPRQRTISLYQLTETWKGWHVIVRPDGDVRTAVRAWGRSWRADETRGNTNSASLIELSTSVGEVKPFVRAEELARKFHLNAPEQLVRADVADVLTVECHQAGGVDVAEGAGDQPPVAQDLGIAVDELGRQIHAAPGQFRFRPEDGFGLLFHTRSHVVHILSDDECLELAPALDGVSR